MKIADISSVVAIPFRVSTVAVVPVIGILTLPLVDIAVTAFIGTMALPSISVAIVLFMAIGIAVLSFISITALSSI